MNPTCLDDTIVCFPIKVICSDGAAHGTTCAEHQRRMTSSWFSLCGSFRNSAPHGQHRARASWPPATCVYTYYYTPRPDVSILWRHNDSIDKTVLPCLRFSFKSPASQPASCIETPLRRARNIEQPRWVLCVSGKSGSHRFLLCHICRHHRHSRRRQHLNDVHSYVCKVSARSSIHRRLSQSRAAVEPVCTERDREQKFSESLETFPSVWDLSLQRATTFNSLHFEVTP